MWFWRPTKGAHKKAGQGKKTETKIAIQEKTRNTNS